jgi:DNA mismatch repair protein MutL
MTLNLSPMDFSFLKEIEHDLRFMGFDLKDCDGNMYQLHGLPAILKGSKAEQLFESILKDIQQEGESDAKNKLFTLLARSISMRSAIQPGKRLTREEMRNITEQLFACQEPGYSPTGRPTYFLIDLKAVDRHFQSNA